jgi:hypothetical protein
MVRVDNFFGGCLSLLVSHETKSFKTFWQSLNILPCCYHQTTYTTNLETNHGGNAKQTWGKMFIEKKRWER